MHIGRTDAQTLGILLVLGDVALSYLGNGDALFIGLLDELVIDVGEVLHELYLIATVFQITAQHIKYADGTALPIWM